MGNMKNSADAAVLTSANGGARYAAAVTQGIAALPELRLTQAVCGM
jgi:N-acetylmuramoyl-L-alanine amidase